MRGTRKAKQAMASPLPFLFGFADFVSSGQKRCN
jgi:hypothetical protein